ncbi:MAG: putative toxin-antitoxin system toxin component, PIN family [Syntrophobacterales bacterium GWC2_56_13]|nr:MAG: putative toxin-antitoxin system toxin component, PIN family [Syntrophobacterales bacterium GWC2_56_13]OHE20873.1 MAG: putative toxin-antitoxin system toxin component, PIN family [Syntrophobacterales bacterium GWF2_56_9]
MRIVPDTNVFIASFFGGNPRTIIDLWKDGRLRLCLSQDIFDEYIEVLRRLGLDDTPELEELLKLFATGFHIVFTTRTPEIHVVADSDDDKFIACALALKAGCVVSGDKALVDVRLYQGIRIVTPKEFLKIMGE